MTTKPFHNYNEAKAFMYGLIAHLNTNPGADFSFEEIVNDQPKGRELPKVTFIIKSRDNIIYKKEFIANPSLIAIHDVPLSDMLNEVSRPGLLSLYNKMFQDMIQIALLQAVTRDEIMAYYASKAEDNKRVLQFQKFADEVHQMD